MAKFEIIEGAPGQGKSLYTASKVEDLLRRNKKWKQKSGVVRKIASNIKFSEAFEKKAEGFLLYWTNTQQLVGLRDVDIVWDEIATELDSRNWVNLDDEMKRFLSQYRKRGVDIYANTQDFSMIDARARLMITSVKSLSKIIGSRDPTPTKPPIKYIWGIVMIREVTNYKETEPDKKKYSLIPDFLLITKSLCDIYDTRQDIKQGELPRLRHVVRYCEHYGEAGHDCSFHKVSHV